MGSANTDARRCIYCPIVRVSWDALTDEHIVPDQIGGKRKVLNASCSYHQDITSGVETRCERQFFFNVRRHLGMTPRKQKKIRTEVQWKSGDPVRANFEAIPLSEHPGIFLVYAFMSPLVLLGQARLEGFYFHYPVPCSLYRTDVRDQEGYGRKHAHKPMVLNRDLDPVMYARMLAKIAHAYTVAELGPFGFKPFLIPLIEGNAPIDASYFVGGSLAELPPAGKVPPAGAQLHEIGFSPPPEPCPGANPNMIVVRIRLFSKFGAPAHYVVVGERCASST